MTAPDVTSLRLAPLAVAEGSGAPEPVENVEAIALGGASG